MPYWKRIDTLPLFILSVRWQKKIYGRISGSHKAILRREIGYKIGVIKSSIKEQDSRE